MRSIAAAFILFTLVAAPVAAQGRGGRDRNGGVPPGHLPPPGECRVWYDGVPPGHQPPPTSCREAERVAARDRDARVIYGRESGGRQRGGVWEDRDRDRDRDRRDDGRAIPRRFPYPDERPSGRYPSRYPDQYPTRGPVYSDVPFENGYDDGYRQGLEDGRDNDGYDPVRHRDYRSGDRGYNSRYGSREEYKAIYRDGFRAGYDDGYQDGRYYERDDRDGGFRLPWPF